MHNWRSPFPVVSGPSRFRSRFGGQRWLWRLSLSGGAIALSACGAGWGQQLTQFSADRPNEITVVSFNVESGGADPTTIARQHIAPVRGADLWGFSEVQNQAWLDALDRGAEAGERADFETILGTTGEGDRLAIVYNTKRLEVVGTTELHELSFDGAVRAPLVAHLRVRDSQQDLLFMVNHLYRSEGDRRHQQAQFLNRWAQAQTLPIIAVGDYNFDFDVTQGDQGQRDAGYDLMTQGGVFRWVRPQTLTATFCSSRYDSILDFIFVAHDATAWSVRSSEVLYADAGTGYCPDTPATSDHRPVMATFEIPR
ncbi:MAG: endonuclease/exonuclease/phosphatase family protein [Synechococcales bacterium]|nr:endonuclease/exonuclease/phosphatase family protein [Synechococcales bacterium]